MQNHRTHDFKWDHRNLSLSSPLSLGIVLSLILLAALTGSVPLLGISPVLIGGFVLAIVIVLVYLQEPAWALYTTIFVNLLPQGLIPDIIASALALLLLLISLLTWLLQTSFQRRKVVWTAPILFVLAFFLWSVVSVLWADNLVVSRQTLVQYITMITIAFLLLNQVDAPHTLDSFMNTLAVSGWVLIGIGLWTILFGGYTLGDRLKIYDMNENLLGPLLMLTTGGIVWQVMRASPKAKIYWMLLSILYILCSLVLIALSGSRGSFIGFALILLVFGTMKATRPWALWGAVLTIVGLVIAPFIFATVLNRFTNDSEDIYGDRDILWKAGIWLMSDYPWTGVGIGNGPYVMLNYVNAVSDTDHVSDYPTRPAHNPILEVGDDTGIVGMLLYLGAVLSAMWLFLRQFLAGVRQRIDALTAYCSLIFCISIGFLSAWVKSGGLADHITLFILLALWVIPYRMQMSADTWHGLSASE